ncbi:MAG: histidine kinase, partial [Desulfobacula sp.]|nr:histidine kinase [Desulfobacula sp.]
MNFKKLRIRLIAAFLLVSLVPLGVLGYKVMSQGETLIEEKASSYLKRLSGRNAEAIKRFMVERENDLRDLSNILCLYGVNPTLLNTHLEQMKSQNSPYLGFLLLDNADNPVFSSIEGVQDPIPWHSMVESGASLQRSGTKNIFMFAIGNRQIPTLMICTRIQENSEENCMHLCGLIDFRLVEAVLRKSNIEETGEVYLVDTNGRFLSASRFGAKALVDRISTHAMDEKNQDLHETIDYRGERVLQAYQKVDAFPWYAIADQDMAEILNRINTLEKEVIVHGILTAIIVFGLAFFISTVIVNILKSKYMYEKKLEFQVIQKEKLASLGLLTSGLAHELNTPLANALLYTQIANEELEESGIGIDIIQQRLSTVVDEVRQGSKIIRNLLDFSRHSQSDAQTNDGNKILRKLMDIAGPHCASNKIEVEIKLEKGMPD